MADIVFTTALHATTPQAVGAHRVYLKLSLFEAWTEVPNLHCDAVSFNAAPSFSTARLYWRYGVGKLPDAIAFDTITRQGVNRYYVLIDFTGMEVSGTTLGFFGTVEIDSDRLDATGDVPSGRQAIECYGVERLLEMQPIRSSWCQHPAADENAIESGSGLTFNAGGLPNRSAEAEDGAFVFTHKSDAEFWTSRNIVQYLLKRHAAIDFGLLAGEVQWELLDDELYTPTFDKPVIDTHGRTVWELLNQLYPRQRMLSFITRLADMEEEEPGVLGRINIVPFSFAQEALDLGEAAGIPANATQHTLDVAADHTASVVITTSSVDVCDRVIVEGARRTTTCTLICPSSTADKSELVRGWPSDLETDYEAAASGEGDYPASTEPAQRALRNKDARSAERFAPVYARFTFGDTFLADQKINFDAVFPLADDPTEAHIVAPLGLNIWPELILLSGHIYDGGAIADGDVTTLHNGPYERRPAMVLTTLPDDPESDPDLRKWVDVRKVGQTADEEDAYDNTTALVDTVRNWSAEVIMPGGDRSIVVRVQGQPQHVIAGDDFTKLSPLADHGERDIARFDYNDFTFTVTIEEDRRCHGRWPTGRVIPEIPRVKYLFAGDKYRCDYVVPDTVVDVFPGTCVRIKSDGGYVNDDRKLLEKIAKLAFQWYGTERCSLTLASSVLDARLIPGCLLTTVSGRQVNACVTSLAIEISRATGVNPGVPKITYMTQFGELDPLNIFPV